MKQALSKRKRAVLEVMSKPKCPAEIRRQMGLKSDSNLSSTIRELLDLCLIYCLNPQARIGKLFGLTAKGKVTRKRLLSEKGVAYGYVEPSNIDWNLYAWVVCGKQRRAILRAMKKPMPLKYIKERAQNYDPRISRMNACDILQLFVEKKIAVKIGEDNRVIFVLTEEGMATRDQLLEP